LGPWRSILAAILIAVASIAFAQEEDGSDDDLFNDPLFDDPFAVTGDDDPDAADDPDDFFEDPFATHESPDLGPSSDQTVQDSDDIFDLDDPDSMFETDEIIEESSSDGESSIDPVSDLLVSEGVTWGGRIRGSVSADFGWDDVWTADFGLFDPTSQELTPDIGASLFFDARPDAEFRAFGKLSIETTTDGNVDFAGLNFDATTIDDSNLPDGWTSEENEDGDTEIRDGSGTLIITIPASSDTTNEADTTETEDPGSLGTAPGLSIAVDELFADYTWTDRLFFRFGKHTIKWGTGYFFSPADVLNLTAVDAEDPTADREGPLSLRVQYPFGRTGNLYLYTIVNAGAEPLDVAVAPKIEFAVGNGELGLGAYYQRTLAPRLVALYSASIREIDVFGEMVGLYGSDRVFVRPSRDQSAAEEDPEDDLNMVLDTFEQSDAFFLQATAGLRYLKEFEKAGSIAIIGQYYFNGEGYADEITGLRPASARLLANPDENGLAIADADAQPDGYTDPPSLGVDDLVNWGRHAVGLTASYSNIFDTNLGISCFLLLSITDWSGIVTPALSWSFLDKFSASASARFTFGDEDDEYTDPAALLASEPAEPTFGLTVSISMPGGSF